MDLSTELNEIQQQAAQQIDGPVMVIAGPGSGKTRVLTFRIAYMISQGVDPFHILALTFTNKAAGEMRERINHIIGSEARSVWMGTFHSVFARILRAEAGRLGYPSNFSIYDTTDSKSLIKRIVKEENLNDKLYKPNIVYGRISNAKNSLITPVEYNQNFNLTAEDESNRRPKIGSLYRTYSKRLFESGAMDFDDLILNMYQLLSQHPDLLYKYQHKFKYIMVDEYQDTNYAQYIIIKLLADVFQNIAVVGDDAQSIYGFRGANIQNILNFEKDYPEVKTFKLEQNYRSTKNIVKIANQIITKNKLQLPKEIWTDNTDGHKAKLIKAASDNDEGRIIADILQLLKLREHYKNSDCAILYRTNAQSRSFEEALRRLNIAYKIYGGLSFYQRKEIKDFMAYLRLTVNHNDEEALRRVINYPKRGIGETSLNKVTLIANETGRTMWDIVSNASLYKLSPRICEAFDNFAVMLKSFRSLMDKKNAYDLAHHIGKSTKMFTELHNDKSVEGLSRYENLQELLNSISEFRDTNSNEQLQEEVNNKNNLGAYLQQVSLLTDTGTDDKELDTVKLMTIHAAKGLEFKVVFVVGLEENLFPSMLSLNSREDLEEERRLFYVACTRAEKQLYLSYANMRYRYGNLQYCEPSRFVDDISIFDLEAVSTSSSKPNIKTSWESPVQQRFNFSKQFSKPNAPKKNNTAGDIKDFKADNPATLQIGMKVIHQRFGNGNIQQIEGEGPARMATINFQKFGQKRILLKYAKLQIVS